VKTSLPRFYKLTRRILRNSAEGADTIFRLAMCQPAPTPSGGFRFDRKPRGTHYLRWTR
jgi:dehydrogenase/reductase SDR family protein 12